MAEENLLVLARSQSRDPSLSQCLGIGNLRCNGKYCCLGVLAEVAGIPMVESEPWSGFFLADHGQGQMAGASVPAAMFGETYGHSKQYVFWDMNDVHGKSFPEIADYIEAHPEIDPKWPPEVK